MALSKRKGTNLLQYNFWWRSQHIQVATKFTNRELARRAENRHRELLASVEAGLPGAERGLAEFLAAMRGEEPPAAAAVCPRFEDYVPKFLEWSAMMHRRVTHALHRDNCETLMRYLSDKRLDEITQEHVEHFMIYRSHEHPTNVNVRNGERIVRTLPGRVSNATVNRAVTTLRKLFTQAQGAFPQLANPTKGVKLLPESPVQRILTDEEWPRYLAAASQPLKDVAVIMHQRGLRPQDVCSLTCRSCDFERQTLELWPRPQPQDRLVARRRTAEQGKTPQSSRIIVMSPEVSEILERRTALARTLGTEYLFPMRDRLNRPMLPGSLTKAHRRTLEVAGISDRIRLYDLRHTFATNATRRLMPLGVLQDILGHASPVVTRRYTQRNDLVAQRAAFANMEKTG